MHTSEKLLADIEFLQALRDLHNVLYTEFDESEKVKIIRLIFLSCIFSRLIPNLAIEMFILFSHKTINDQEKIEILKAVSFAMEEEVSRLVRWETRLPKK